MTNLLYEEDVDIYKLPKSITVPTKNDELKISIGDLHANAIKVCPQ